jgi:hypothetical protein
VHFIYKEDIPRFQGREHGHQIAGPLEYGSGRGANIHVQFFGHQQRQRGLAETGRTKEQRMIERLFALLGGIDRDLQGFFDLGLPDEFIQTRRAQRGIGETLALQRLGRGYFRASHESDPLLFGNARQRTG